MARPCTEAIAVAPTEEIQDRPHIGLEQVGHTNDKGEGAAEPNDGRLPAAPITAGRPGKTACSQCKATVHDSVLLAEIQGDVRRHIVVGLVTNFHCTIMRGITNLT